MSRINLNKLPMIDLQKISDPVLTKGADQKLLTRQAQLKFLIYATQKDHSELKQKYSAAMGQDMPPQQDFIDLLKSIESVMADPHNVGYATYSNFFKNNNLEKAKAEGKSFTSVAEFNPAGGGQGSAAASSELVNNALENAQSVAGDGDANLSEVKAPHLSASDSLSKADKISPKPDAVEPHKPNLGGDDVEKVKGSDLPNMSSDDDDDDDNDVN